MVLGGYGWAIGTQDENKYVSKGEQTFWCETPFEDICFEDASEVLRVRLLRKPCRWFMACFHCGLGVGFLQQR